jgi:hypothetical protein
MQTVAVGALVISETGKATWAVLVAALGFVRLGRPSGEPAALLTSLRSGFTVARQETSCWSAITAIAVVAFLASPFIALVPVMAEHLTRGGARAVAQTTALLTTAQGAGAVTGALCLAPLAARLSRGRVLSFFLVALGVAYPVGALAQGPVIDRIGLGWTTAGAAVLLALVMAAVAYWRRDMARAITGDGPAAAR